MCTSLRYSPADKPTTSTKPVKAARIKEEIVEEDVEEAAGSSSSVIPLKVVKMECESRKKVKNERMGKLESKVERIIQESPAEIESLIDEDDEEDIINCSQPSSTEKKRLL